MIQIHINNQGDVHGWWKIGIWSNRDSATISPFVRLGTLMYMYSGRLYIYLDVHDLHTYMDPKHTLIYIAGTAGRVEILGIGFPEPIPTPSRCDHT